MVRGPWSVPWFVARRSKSPDGYVGSSSYEPRTTNHGASFRQLFLEVALHRELDGPSPFDGAIGAEQAAQDADVWRRALRDVEDVERFRCQTDPVTAEPELFLQRRVDIEVSDARSEEPVAGVRDLGCECVRSAV